RAAAGAPVVLAGFGIADDRHALGDGTIVGHGGSSQRGLPRLGAPERVATLPKAAVGEKCFITRERRAPARLFSSLLQRKKEGAGLEAGAPGGGRSLARSTPTSEGGLTLSLEILPPAVLGREQDDDQRLAQLRQPLTTRSARSRAMHRESRRP